MATRKTAKKATRKKTSSRKTTKKAAKKKAAKKREGFSIVDLLRNPVLASVGAFSLAEEGIERLVKELVDRGEASEREGKKIVEDYRRRTQKSRKDLEKNIDKRISSALRPFRLPTKKDLNDLEKKINALERKVDRLLKQRSASSSGTPSAG